MRQGTAKVVHDRCLERGRGVFFHPPRWLQEVERAEGVLGWLGTGRGWGESVMQEGVLLSVPNPNGAVRLQVNLLPSLSLASWRCSCSNSNPSPHSIPNTCTSLGAWESQAACHPSFLRKRRPKELKTQWLVVVSPTPGSYRPSVKMFLTARRRRQSQRLNPNLSNISYLLTPASVF